MPAEHERDATLELKSNKEQEGSYKANSKAGDTDELGERHVWWYKAGGSEDTHAGVD